MIFWVFCPKNGSTVWKTQMCNPQKISVAELFSAISSWDWAQNEGWTFVLQDHKKKISQFPVVRSVSTKISNHSEKPSALLKHYCRSREKTGFWIAVIFVQYLVPKDSLNQQKTFGVSQSPMCLLKKYLFHFKWKPDYLPELHHLPEFFKNFKVRSNLWLKSNLLMPKTLL